uniref:Uncharacterized protein n=1 Tax=Physcomitrium patens TaxID=3218 RepID=A0A2K1JD13_PHYPA|nr:hypothetical protein PHYPA_019676 [Physcomitrium patens]
MGSNERGVRIDLAHQEYCDDVFTAQVRGHHESRFLGST